MDSFPDVIVRTSDVIEGLTQPMRLLGVYFVIAFFASQMFACFEYSHLDKCIAIMGANVLSPVRSDSLWILILFILFTALINLIMVSSTSKWAFMSLHFRSGIGGYGDFSGYGTVCISYR